MNIKVEKLIPGGQALATLEDGKKIFLWNALPGETVTDFTITKKKSSYLEGIATKIENPSPFRIEPADPCYLSTSPWQIMTYDYELEQKRELLLEQFRQFGINLFGTGDAKMPTWEGPESLRGLARDTRKDGMSRRASQEAFCIRTRSDDSLPITDGNYLHYRNKMEYALYWDNESGKISLAFHNRGSHRKLPIEKSSLERKEIYDAAEKIVCELNRSHSEARKYQSLLLRCNKAGKVSGGLFENGKPHPVFENLTDEILGETYSYSPNGFFQINLPVYELALKEIKKHIKTEKVLDLYSGVGTIGLSVARDRELTLVECNKSAFGELIANVGRVTQMALVGGVRSSLARMKWPEPREDGREGPRPPKEPLCQDPSSNSSICPILANSEDCLDYISPDETVILDPPRAGCDKKLIDKLLEETPETIIYLSCNPATQARDVALLLEKYRITSQSSYNFFPRTPHLENLIILER